MADFDNTYQEAKPTPHVTADVDQLLDEIKDYIDRNTQVTRDEICVQFGLDERAYQKLQRRLRDEPRYESVGGRAGGGFRVAQNVGGLAREAQESSIDQLLQEDHEKQAARLLAGMFNARELRELLDDRADKALRGYKRHLLNRDADPTMSEAACALVIQHGTELFRQSEIRAAVAKKCRVKNVGKWHAGRRAAAEFVSSVGFPSEFAGERNDDRPPHFLLLEEKRRYPALHPFQVEAKRRLLEAVHRPSERVLLELPTGAGKTRIAVDTMREFLANAYKAADRHADICVIWCAHQEELCEQAAKTIQDAWTNAEEASPLALVRLFTASAEHDPNVNRPDDSDEEYIGVPMIVVTTPARALRLLRDGDGQFALRLQRQLRLLVIDEAHRAAAPTYRSILETINQIVPVIGLTATPYGKIYIGEDSTKELLKLFNDNKISPDALFDDYIRGAPVAENPKRFMQQRGILAKPIVSQLWTGKKLHTEALWPLIRSSDNGQILDLESAESADRMLAKDVAGRIDRTNTIFKKLLPVFRQNGASILYFAPTVRDALTMTFLLRVEGVTAECVHAGTPAGLRSRYISTFKKGHVRVLCNVEVLTTGFDAPRVTHVVVARPTVSRVLYEQIVGRGLRGPEFGGTSECEIIDCLDTDAGQRVKFGYQYFREDWSITSPLEIN